MEVLCIRLCNSSSKGSYNPCPTHHAQLALSAMTLFGTMLSNNWPEINIRNLKPREPWVKGGYIGIMANKMETII